MIARVLVCDDHAPMRELIAGVLDADPEFEVCGAVGDAAAAVDASLRERPDICLLDIRMPGGGIEAAWEIGARLRETKVVMLTVSDDHEDLLAALRAGAAGYLLKSMDPQRLPHALRDVLNGGAAIPHILMRRVIQEVRDPASRRRTAIGTSSTSHLTSREWEVLELLRLGLSTAEIARRLVLTQATVRSHIAAMMRKLRAQDRAEIIEMFPAS
jgi:DNA-binding NarL/FixJ family response regulator